MSYKFWRYSAGTLLTLMYFANVGWSKLKRAWIEYSEEIAQYPHGPWSL